MLDIRKRHTLVRERILADGIMQVAAEMRLVEVADYIAFLRLERYGNIADIVTSSSELYLKHGVLRFSGSGAVKLTWSSPPIIALSLEFRHLGVVAHFQLELGASSAAVDIGYIEFAEPGVDDDAETELLREAVADAHLRVPTPIH